MLVKGNRVLSGLEQVILRQCFSLMTLVTLGWQRLKSNWLNGRQRLTSRSLPRPLLMHSTLLRFTYMQCTAFHFKNIRHSNALHCTELSESLLQRRTLKEAQALPALKGARVLKDGLTLSESSQNNDVPNYVLFLFSPRNGKYYNQINHILLFFLYSV